MATGCAAAGSASAPAARARSKQDRIVMDCQFQAYCIWGTDSHVSVAGCSLLLLFPRHLRIGEHFYMNLTLARNWWSLVIRGIVGILLGIISFAWPHVT